MFYFFLCVESVLLDDSTKASSRRNGSVPGTTKPPTLIVYAGSMAPTPSVVIVTGCFVGVVVAILIVLVIAWRHCNHRCCRHPLLPSSVVAVAIVVAAIAVALATVFVACCPRCHHHHCPICLNILVPTLFLLSIVVLVICSALNIRTR